MHGYSARRDGGVGSSAEAVCCWCDAQYVQSLSLSLSLSLPLSAPQRLGREGVESRRGDEERNREREMDRRMEVESEGWIKEKDKCRLETGRN